MGYIVGKDGVKMDNSKIIAIVNLKSPNNRRE
jgi:hypothetical protein